VNIAKLPQQIARGLIKKRARQLRRALKVRILLLVTEARTFSAQDPTPSRL
jgi:hypothetical protein